MEFIKKSLEKLIKMVVFATCSHITFLGGLYVIHIASKDLPLSALLYTVFLWVSIITGMLVVGFKHIE